MREWYNRITIRLATRLVNGNKIQKTSTGMNSAMSSPYTCNEHCGQNHFKSIENAIAVVKWCSFMADSKDNIFDNTLE